MSAHTQGRVDCGVMVISIGDVAHECFVVGIPETTKAVAITGLVSDAENRDESIEDARRLAACWNVCDGVKTEILEQAGTRNDWCDLMQGLEQERDELQREVNGKNAAIQRAHDRWFDAAAEHDKAKAINAELLAALENAVADEPNACFADSARAAIAKAKGGAA